MSELTTLPLTVQPDLTEIVSAVFAAWSDEEIPYVVLRNYATLPQSVANDIDILVPACQVHKAENLLLEITAQQGWRLWHRVEFSPISLWFTRNSLLYPLHIDLFVTLEWHGIELVSSELVFSRLKDRGLFNIPSPIDESIINLLTSFLYQGHIKDKYKYTIKMACQNNYQVLTDILSSKFGVTLAEYLVKAIIHSDWSEIEARVNKFRTALLLRYLLHKPVIFARTLCHDAGRLSRRLIRPAGGIVALVGPDGVGKSAVIEEVCKQLDESRLFHRIIVRHWRPGLLPPLSRLLGDTHGNQDVPGPPRRESGRYHWLRLAYYGIDFALGYMLKDLLHISRLRLVMYDRCALDMAVDPLRYGLRTAVGTRHMWSITPKPDLVIFLHDTPEHIFARRQELEPVEIARQLQEWLQLAERGDVGAIIHIDAAPDAIASRVKDIIVEGLRQKCTYPRTSSGEQSRGYGSILSHDESGDSPLLRQPIIPANSFPSPKGYWYGKLLLRNGRGYLIPLAPRMAAAHALDLYNAQTGPARYAKGLLAAGLRFGVAQPFMRHVYLSDTSNAFSEHVGDAHLLEHLKEVIGLPDVHFAISLGTPGPHRKPVFQVLTSKGSTIGYVKVGRNDTTNVLVQNEVQALRRLKADFLRSCTAPVVMHAGWWQGHFLCIQSPPNGKLTVAPRTLVPSYLAIPDELAVIHTRWIALRETVFWAALQQRIKKISNAYYLHILQKGMWTAETLLGNGPLPFHYSHGDFAPWNARTLNHGLLLFDWEYAAAEAPPGYDLIHFAVQTAMLLNKWSPGQTCLWMQSKETGGKSIAPTLSTPTREKFDKADRPLPQTSEGF